MTSPRDPPDGAGSTASQDRCIESNAIAGFACLFRRFRRKGGEEEGKNVGYFTFLMGMTRMPPIMAQTPAM